MLYYRGVNDTHVVINRDKLVEVFTDFITDNVRNADYVKTSEQVAQIIESILDKDAKSVLSNLLE